MNIDERVAATIATEGFVIIGITSAKIPYIFTIGVHRVNEPELIVTGLDADSVGYTLLSTMATLVRKGLPLQPGEIPVAKFGGHTTRRLHVVEVLPELVPVWMDQAVVYHRNAGRESRPVPVYQLVWTDPSGRLPWEDRYHGDYPQPVLTNADVPAPQPEP